MLPSMPVLFTRESQDAFGKKVDQTTSFFSQNVFPKAINPEPPPVKVEQVSKPPAKDVKKTTPKKKQDPLKFDYNNALVKAYYSKVQSKFASHQSVPTNKFVQFQNILRTYNPRKETPVDLYKRIESLFGVENKELVEEFLLFLTPGQACTVGRFMDRFALVQMSSFIQLLQNTFARKPTVLRKIMRSITTGIKSGSSVEMKTRVLPHLRSSPKLIQMYKALFPDERPPDSWSESATTSLNESFLKSDTGCDFWEIKDENDNKKQKNDGESTRLDTLYHHGRIFLKHGRMVRPACVTYPFSKEPYRVHVRRLTSSTANYISPTESEDDTATTSKRRNAAKIPPKRNKKQTKSPTKNVKDVNDNTKHKDSTINSPKAKGKSNAKSKNVKDKKESDTKIDLQKINKKEKSDLKYLSEGKDGVKTLLVKPEAPSNSSTVTKKLENKGSLDYCNIKVKQEATQIKNKTSNGLAKKTSETKNTTKTEELNEKVLKTKQIKTESIKITIMNNENLVKTKIVDVSIEEAKAKKPRIENVKIIDCKQSLETKPAIIIVDKNSQTIPRSLSSCLVETTPTINTDKPEEILKEVNCKHIQPIKLKEVDNTESIKEKALDKANSWTRDEDKTMLQILKGEAGSDQVFGRIHDVLPHRSVTEIRERLCQVMSLLQKMAVGEVT